MDVLPQIGAILAVFVLLGLTLWWLRRRGAVQIAPFAGFHLPSGRQRPGQPRLLQKVEGLQLSPTHSLSLVRMADRAILIGTSPSGFYLVESSAWKTLQSQSPAQPENQS